MPDNNTDEREHVSRRDEKKFKLNFCVGGIFPEKTSPGRMIND